jgi:G3E family GTPase
MRTPVVLVGGQGDSDRVAGTLMATPGTAVVGHEYDGQVVRRWVSIMRDGELSTSEWPLELTDGCICCTTRNDLLILLRRLHRRDDVTRIVVLLAPWSEPEPLCVAISDEPALRDVRIDAVLTTVDPGNWLNLAVGADELDDGRTVAQVVVGQAEFADVLVLSQPDATTLSILRRLAPLARITVGVDRVEQALAHLDPHTRRGRRRDPHDPLLAGQPPLDPAGEITLMEFTARRPFHPERLHAAIDMLLDGVVRTRGRVFVANRLDDIMWIESAGGGVLIENAGKWLAAMGSNEQARTDPARRALAATGWDDRFGDRHISMAVLVCGARPAEIDSALRGALLTDHELARPGEWSHYPDPFGDWHADPCEELPDIRDELTVRTNHRREDGR